MAWFKKKSDPISERAKALNSKIAEVEAEIRRLTNEQERATREPRPAPAPKSAKPSKPGEAQTQGSGSSTRPSAPKPEAKPKLRSTALPPGHPRAGASARAGEQAEESQAPQPKSSGPASSVVPAAVAKPEPVFEEMTGNPFRKKRPDTQSRPRELDVASSESSPLWRRVSRHFQGPATSNPKLVRYLAAGNIQGLRPLRYEKRVARNRFILLLFLLILILWGIIAILMNN